MAPAMEESHLVSVTAEPMVNYTVKEVLERIERKQDMHNERMLGRLDNLENRLTAIELEKTHRNAFRDNWQAWVALIAAIAAGAGAILAVVHIHG